MKALSGANPLLAPGMLAFAAMIALAATYYHPVLQSTSAKIDSTVSSGKEQLSAHS